ncbi:MAG TPA: AAA family ATPase [Gaiellaceae bacterium]|jgi:capsular exopolysaccharide synthesis family protein|nr:AAA family ATPase [Gaiellaceae bacterium]
MTSSFDQTDFRGPVRYLQAFRAHRVLIVALIVIAVGIAAGISYTATKQYNAEADLQVQALPAYGGDPFQGFDLFRQTVDGSSPVVAAARVLGSAPYQRAVFKTLGKQGKGVSIAVTPLSQADIVSLSATAPNARQAAAAANAYADMIITVRGQLFQTELTARMRQVEAQMAAIPADVRQTSATYQTLAGTLAQYKSYVGTSDPTVQVLTRAEVPGAASWPRPKLSMAVALLIGLLLGLGAAVTLELVNPRVSREDELTFLHRLPILARIPRISSRTAHGYLSGRALLPADVWKGYRTLRAVLANAGRDGGYPRSILVTSASPGDAKTMTAVNLAIALAAAELRVTLIDADFHRPMIGTIFNVTGPRDGLVRFLNKPDTADVVSVPAATHPRLKLLLGNREQMHQLHLLDTARFERLLERLYEDNDVIVIDSPPLPEVAEALALADAADTVIVSVRIGHTRRDKLSELRELLGRRGVSPLGFVVTTRSRSGGQSAYDYSTDMATTPVSAGILARLGDRQRVAPATRDK